MLDAHQLNVFLIASETLNFTETGKRLHMTQPTVSQHIQALENHFDSKLFHRNGRHLELTDAGKILVPLARDLIKVSVHIDETMESLKGDIYGHLLVGCSTTPGKYVLPHLLAAKRPFRLYGINQNMVKFRDIEHTGYLVARQVSPGKGDDFINGQ